MRTCSSWLAAAAMVLAASCGPNTPRQNALPPETSTSTPSSTPDGERPTSAVERSDEGQAATAAPSPRPVTPSLPDLHGWLTAFDAQDNYAYAEAQAFGLGSFGPATLTVGDAEFSVAAGTPFSGTCGPPLIAVDPDQSDGPGASAGGCLVFIEETDEGEVGLMHLIQGRNHKWSRDTGLAAIYEPRRTVKHQGALRVEPAGMVLQVSDSNLLLLGIETDAAAVDCPVTLAEFDTNDLGPQRWGTWTTIDVKTGLVTSLLCYPVGDI